MTMNAMATPAITSGPSLRLLTGGPRRAPTWWEKRAAMRRIVGGCPDHWWKATAPRTAACTCDRF